MTTVSNTAAVSAAINAAASESGHPVLNAGRGQPNWIAIAPRDACFVLGRFAVSEMVSASPDPMWGASPVRAGIAGRLDDWLEGDASVGAGFLRAAVGYGIDEFGFDPDVWVLELVRGVLGDGYPAPHRMLAHLETVVARYFTTVVGADPIDSGPFEVFATEGGAAAMAYVFRSLQENHVIGPGDKVAIATPVFTPYLQIPHLEDFGLEVVDIHTDHRSVHRFSHRLFERLLDPEIKVFFLVNPGNPDTRAITADELHALHDLIADHRPDLLIVADTVYATFIDGFRGLAVDSPRNVIGLHSFSKNYGATGSRLGFIAMHHDHVVDELLATQDEAGRRRQTERYSSLTDDVSKLSFMARLVADSREVALNNIAGLATPDQVQMAFFALDHLMVSGRDYTLAVRHELAAREQALLAPLGVGPPGGQESMYYALIDLEHAMEVAHGPAATAWMTSSVDPIEISMMIAREHGVVVLPGQIFESDSWDVRVSLASLTVDELAVVGRAIGAVLGAVAARIPDDASR
ncbi:bifunctional aspartate transaminase/aspartate 4-decarboxylase [Ilumatobacter nonamiensis]|uniref:bifunctional aspartate transaminase/aspartate 4-decarboxylase n=1 Tax=Ilumatobacter nonamiensis TaxID=467093 RepID=UPI000687F6DA|nr:bifunctional aspartate transaminase/aspartate 4-decarboxylase [Ilumatobacter nonamiensis]